MIEMELKIIIKLGSLLFRMFWILASGIIVFWGIYLHYFRINMILGILYVILGFVMFIGFKVSYPEEK